MNKQYKVIWSKVKNTYVVVSELAKRNGKSESGSSRQYVSAAAVLAAVAVLSIPGVVAAQDGVTTFVDPANKNIQMGNGTNLTNTINSNKTHFYSVNSTDTTAGNYNNNGATGSNALAAGVATSAQTTNSVAIGTNARVLGNGGNRDTGTGAIAIGEDAVVTTNGLNLTSIAMGKGATVLNGSGKQDRALSFTPDNYTSASTLPIDPDKSPGGIAIGANAYARTGSVQIGSHTMKGYTMGGSKINDQSQANLVGMTTIGSNSYNKGALGSMLGAYSVMTGDFTGAGGFNSLRYGSQNFGANVVGSLNSIRSAGYSGASGIANSIVGVGNIAENANGALIYGAGNKITNSVQSISGINTSTSTSTVDEMADALRKGIQSSGGGGSTLAIGGGNTADYTQNTAIIGVNNTVTGTSADIAQYNSVTGYKNTATNVDNVTITGINNTVSDIKTAVVIGDNRTLTGVNNNVIIGSADTGTTTTVNNAVAIGRNTNVSYDGGVALGANSLATVDKGAIGYDPLGQITDTDSIGALNKTQYDALKSSIESSNSTVSTLTSDIADLKQQQSQYDRWSDEYSDLQNQIDAKQTELTAAQNSLAADQTEMNKLVSTWQATGAAVSVGDSSTGLTRQITNVAAGTNDTDAVNVAQLKQVASAAEEASKTTLQFAGDDNNATITRGNGQQLNITGGAASDNLTDNNIGVVKSADDTLQVKLSKDLNALNSVRIGGSAEGEGIYIAKQSVKNSNGVAEEGNYITGLDNTKWDPANQGIVENRAATEGQLKDVADSISKQISDIDTAVKSSSRVFESDSGADKQVTRKNTDAMKLKGGADANNLSDNNIGVVNNSDGSGFDIKLSKDIKGLNSIEVANNITIGSGDNQTIINDSSVNTGSVTTGNTTINNSGLTIKNDDGSNGITIQNNNVSMGGNVIQNVGEGVNASDAINKGQFDRAISNIDSGMGQMDNRINKLDNRVNRVGAGAAALAALHPLEFSPEAKWEVSAGLGNYKDANAVALGAFYRPNGDTMFSVGTSFGGGENMVNAGVTLRIGDGETQKYPSKKVMAQKINDLETVVADQNSKIEELTRLVNTLINK